MPCHFIRIDHKQAVYTSKSPTKNYIPLFPVRVNTRSLLAMTSKWNVVGPGEYCVWDMIVLNVTIKKVHTADKLQSQSQVQVYKVSCSSWQVWQVWLHFESSSGLMSLRSKDSVMVLARHPSFVHSANHGLLLLFQRKKSKSWNVLRLFISLIDSMYNVPTLCSNAPSTDPFVLSNRLPDSRIAATQKSGAWENNNSVSTNASNYPLVRRWAVYNDGFNGIGRSTRCPVVVKLFACSFGTQRPYFHRGESWKCVRTYVQNTCVRLFFSRWNFFPNRAPCATRPHPIGYSLGVK